MLLIELLGLLGCGCTAEMVETDVEPFVNFVMKFEILVADLLRRQSLFQSFCFGRRSVLVRTANVQRVVVT